MSLRLVSIDGKGYQRLLKVKIDKSEKTFQWAIYLLSSQILRFRRTRATFPTLISKSTCQVSSKDDNIPQFPTLVELVFNQIVPLDQLIIMVFPLWGKSDVFIGKERLNLIAQKFF